MSFNVIGSLRVYLDMPKGGDPRTFLAAIYEGDEQVHPFDANGVPADEAPLAALIQSAKGARVMASDADRLWAGSYFGVPETQILSLPPSEEARLRLLAGRARKASPLTPERAEETLSNGELLCEDLDALLSDVPEIAPLTGYDPLSEDPDALLSDDPARAPEAETGANDPVPSPIEHDPFYDDLDAFFSEIPPEGGQEKHETVSSSALDEELDRLRAHVREITNRKLEELPAEVKGDPVTGPAETDDTGPASGPDADPLTETPEGSDELERGNPLDVYPVLEKHRAGALDWISASFRPQWRHDRGLSAILSELRDLREDPDRYLRPGYYELYGVRFRRDILDPDRYVCLALTQKTEGRIRLRLVRFNEAPDLRAHQEEAMRALCAYIACYEYGPMEALFPRSVALPPELMRAGGFEHLQDLPRWYWGTDCALWIRNARR